MKSNADLQKDVYEELKWDARINEGDIGVSVNNGVVTLSGTIPSFAEKWAAEQASKRVVGVGAVVNKIDVKLVSTHIKDDQDIAHAAMSAVKWNVWVPDESIKVVVEKGWVTLTGKVEFDFQRRAAESAVRHLAGVRGVSNEIAIEPAVKPRDVQYQIKRAIHRHAERDADNIQIDVVEDEVTLSGKVHSWDEKKAAEWAALGTSGVRKVKNNVIVSTI